MTSSLHLVSSLFFSKATIIDPTCAPVQIYDLTINLRQERSSSLTSFFLSFFTTTPTTTSNAE